jgi:hypothetical protein
MAKKRWKWSKRRRRWECRRCGRGVQIESLVKKTWEARGAAVLVYWFCRWCDLGVADGEA